LRPASHGITASRNCGAADLRNYAAAVLRCCGAARASAKHQEATSTRAAARTYHEKGRGTGDEYTFNLTAANGEKILSSERYASHSGAVRGVAAVKENAVLDARYERRDARDGTMYFVLEAGNGEIVGTSEMYSGSSARKRELRV
jgi:uncharacterized protein YegP (UPF0339 family)